MRDNKTTRCAPQMFACTRAGWRARARPHKFQITYLSVAPYHIPTRELMRRTHTAVIVLIVAVAGAVALGLSGLGYQQELWTLRTAFTMVKWTAYLGIATGLVALTGLIMTRRQRAAMLVHP